MFGGGKKKPSAMDAFVRGQAMAVGNLKAKPNPMKAKVSGARQKTAEQWHLASPGCVMDQQHKDSATKTFHATCDSGGG